MSLIQILIAIAATAFAGLLGWAIATGDFLQEGAVLLSLPWGQVTLADLYLGFFLYAVLVFVVERSKLSAAFWALPVFVLGNVWAALWFILRWKQIVARLRPPPETPQP
jgi:hypothetical protein